LKYQPILIYQQYQSGFKVPDMIFNTIVFADIQAGIADMADVADVNN